MIIILLVTPDKASFSGLAAALEKEEDIKLFWAESGNAALKIVSGTAIDLVVTDEDLKDMTGLELLEKILSVNPMINSAAVNLLPPEEFHEASEGLGILAQLPQQPGLEEATFLLQSIRSLKERMSGFINS